MRKNEFLLEKEITQSFVIKNEIQNNNNTDNSSNQNQLSQMFNNLYDSHFLIIINELSSQIQSFYKSSIIHFNMINSFLDQSENEDFKKLSNIQSSFKNIESLFFEFYSTAKILFKKMKIYRSEKIKNIRHYSLNNIHKKQAILFNKDKKNIPLLNLENIKHNNNKKDNICNGGKSLRSNGIDKIVYLDKSNESSINNKGNNSNNNFSQSCNTTIDKESNIILMIDKNQHSHQLLEYFNNLNKELKSLQDTLLSNEYNNEKIQNYINIIKNIIKSIKDSLSSSNNIINENVDKNLLINLSNKINLLIEENDNIKNQYEKYRTEEKIKRKFFENQILILSNKNNENEKKKKITQDKFKEMKNKLEEITNLNTNIISMNSNLNEELKIKSEKIIELQNKLDEKIKDNIKSNNYLDIKIEKTKVENEKIKNELKEKDIKIKELSLINNNNLLLNQKNNDINKIENIFNNFDNNDDPNNSNLNIKKENLIEKINPRITPEYFSIIKIIQISNKLKWILFKKNKKHIIHFKRYSFVNNSNSINQVINNNTIILNNPTNELNDNNYSDYFWIPYKSDQDFVEFGDLSIFIEKEKEYDNIINKLNQKNRIFENEIEQLKIENYNLNNIILAYKLDNKDDKNFVGISFIEEDPENSKFIDEKCCEEILIGLNKNKDIMNLKKKENINNIKLKKSIDMLIKNVNPSETFLSLFSSILKQLGCSDEDITKLIGK